MSVLWAQAYSGGPMASVQLLQQADDEIQTFFNSGFSVYPAAITEPAFYSGSFVISPNPFHDFANISFPETNSFHSYTVELYDVNGKAVRRYQKISAKNFTISRDGLKSGTYFLNVSSEGKQIKAEKLIVVD
jgi:hypothetical protein